MSGQLSQPGQPAKERAETQRIWARSALTTTGWRESVVVEVAADGTIANLEVDTKPDDALRDSALRVEILLPAPGNLHSHAFQRGMAGLSEHRLSEHRLSERRLSGHPASKRVATGARDSFWTWREVMYHFVERLTPEDVEAIAALAYVEMLEAGYAAVGEFHYLHHDAAGRPYDDIAELSWRIFAAARSTGIGLTHLPVLYCRAGLAGEELAAGQRRFRCDRDRFARLFERIESRLQEMPRDTRLGVAPHSLRAVDPEELAFAVEIAPRRPLHIHVAEQIAEVEAVEAAYGKPPVDWLLDQFAVDDRWCLIHATQMTGAETERLARSGAVVGLCPITESNLGDGIFRGHDYLRAAGRFGVGSDSNIRISLSEEIRTLEYSQRLRDRERAVLVDGDRSVGRTLFEGVVHGGAQALDRCAGGIVAGALADLVSLRDDGCTLSGLHGDSLLDGWIFAGDDRLVDHVWAAGRHVVEAGRHRDRDAVVARASPALSRLRGGL